MPELTKDALPLRKLIHDFIQGRLQEKLDKLKPDESDKRAEQEASHQPVAWLRAAARRVSQISLATHTIKPIHPDARGTNLFVRHQLSAAPGIVGSNEADCSRFPDIVGNAAALDVYKMLSLEHEGQTLLALVIEKNAHLLAALSDDPQEAEEIRQALATIGDSKSPPASHTLAKQLYFPVSEGDYHLLAPLFPSTLVHVVQQQMKNDRFGEDARAAREARKHNLFFADGYREYPDMAVQKFGGTKPQNISLLNSERRGENWLLASLPPEWVGRNVTLPFGIESIFPTHFARQRRVREMVVRLRTFLEAVAHNNWAIRKRRARLVQDICDELHQYVATLRQATGGWSSDTRCELHAAERLWLDPTRAAIDAQFATDRQLTNWRLEVSHRFGNWLNSALSSDKLHLGEVEQAAWKADLAGELSSFESSLGEDDE